MNVSQVQIVNLALNKVGATGTIASLDEASPNAEKVLAVWDLVFQIVLAERDWKFAKTRVLLQRSTLVPSYGYKYAYVVPSDFVRLVRQKNAASKGRNPTADPWGGYYDFDAASRPWMYDTPIWPPGFPYIFETMLDTDGNATKCLLIDYDNTVNPLMMNYIQVVTDMTLLTPAFVRTLATALAAEVCIPIKEDKERAAELRREYTDSLNTAEALNEQADYLAEEAGSTSWIDAGR
jgi:hypothetical protein